MATRNYSSPIRELIRRTIRALVLQAPQRDQHYLSELYETYCLRDSAGSLSLDLGCGPELKRNPFHAKEVVGAEIQLSNDPRVIPCDLFAGALPFDSSSISAITAYDVLEHIPRAAAIRNEKGVIESYFPFIALINEVYRILSVDGLFFAIYPAYPFPMAFQDPKHCNIMTEDSFKLYFCRPSLWGKIYGFSGGFELLDEGWCGSHYFFLARK